MSRSKDDGGAGMSKGHDWVFIDSIGGDPRSGQWEYYSCSKCNLRKETPKDDFKKMFTGCVYNYIENPDGTTSVNNWDEGSEPTCSEMRMRDALD